MIKYSPADPRSKSKFGLVTAAALIMLLKSNHAIYRFGLDGAGANSNYPGFAAFGEVAIPLEWHFALPPQRGYLISAAISYGNNRFVLVEQPTTILTSPDGLSWSQTAITNALAALTFGDQFFVAVGGTNIFTSRDGLNWTKQLSGTSQPLAAVTWGNGLFVAVGRGIVVTSPDGTNWTAHTASELLNAVTFGNGRFVAAGNGTLISPDGRTWSSITNGPAGIEALSFGNGRFVALSSASPPGFIRVIYTSADGIKWTGKNISGYSSAITYGNGNFVIPANDGVYVSTDGLSWTQVPLPETILGASTLFFSAITFGNGRFVAACKDRRFMMTSPDAYEWEIIGKPRTSFGYVPEAITYGNERFVLASYLRFIYSSQNGYAWKTHMLPFNASVSDIIFANGKFVAVGSAHYSAGTTRIRSWASLISDDGDSWQAFRIDQPLAAITRGPSQYVGAGDDGAVATSADAVT